MQVCKMICAVSQEVRRVIYVAKPASQRVCAVRLESGPASTHQVLLGHGADEARARDARRRRAALSVVLARAGAAPARAAHLHARPLCRPPHTVLLCAEM